MEEYTAWVDLLANTERAAFLSSDVRPASQEEESQDRLLDMIMLSLRTADGLNLNEVSSTFGQSVADAIEEAVIDYEKDGLVKAIIGHRVRLTDPDGFLISNDIISSIFAKIS
jgi:oxygen-independent coproporphyrinogen-3 oxidase